MRRTIISCLSVLCLVALIAWVYMKHPGKGSAVASDVGTSNGHVPHEMIRLAEKSARDWMRVFTLQMQFAFFGDDQFSPCYVDLDNKTLYRWKGVVLGREQVPGAYKSFPSRIRMLNSKEFTVLSIEAPVKYREINGQFRPGYLDRSCWTFYAWKGVVLRKEEMLEKGCDGQDAMIKPFQGQFIGKIEIDMPAHLKDHPELWKKQK